MKLRRAHATSASTLPEPGIAQRASGFTLPELVMIIVIVSVLAALAVPRLNVESFQEGVFAGQLTTALRHARQVAIQSGCSVQADLDRINDVASFSYTGAGGAACPAGVALPDPSRSGALVIEGGIRIGGVFVFDAEGRSAGGQVQTDSGDVIVIGRRSGYIQRQ